MDRALPLFLEVLGGASLTSAHSAGLPARDRVLGQVGCRRAAGEAGVLPVGANPGPSPHTMAPAPPVDSPRHPRAGVRRSRSRGVSASLSPHTRLLSVPFRLRRLRRTDGRSPPGTAVGEEEPMGTSTFAPGDVPSSSWGKALLL